MIIRILISIQLLICWQTSCQSKYSAWTDYWSEFSKLTITCDDSLAMLFPNCTWQVVDDHAVSLMSDSNFLYVKDFDLKSGTLFSNGMPFKSNPPKPTFVNCMPVGFKYLQDVHPKEGLIYAVLQARDGLGIYKISYRESPAVKLIHFIAHDKDEIYSSMSIGSLSVSNEYLCYLGFFNELIVCNLTTMKCDMLNKGEIYYADAVGMIDDTTFLLSTIADTAFVLNAKSLQKTSSHLIIDNIGGITQHRWNETLFFITETKLHASGPVFVGSMDLKSHKFINHKWELPIYKDYPWSVWSFAVRGDGYLEIRMDYTNFKNKKGFSKNISINLNLPLDKLDVSDVKEEESFRVY